MKKLLPLILIFFGMCVTAQVTNEGIPKSWETLDDHEQIVAKQLPTFDLEAVKAEDAINDTQATKPWRFGYMHSVNYGLEDGQWTTLDNGDRIWRIAIESRDALSMNFIFDDFYVPNGASVYLYNDDRSDLLGAYTSVQNQESGILGTWLVEGEKVWIEYFEPLKVLGQGRLHIAKATHGYRNAASYNEAKALNSSGDCNQDVDCSVGNDYDLIKDHNKRSVGILLSGGSGFCSGALINNTNNDGTPYFLTANHCFSDPAAWSFRFGWISPEAICADTEDSENGPTDMTLSGGTLRARSANADFCLVEINSPIPAEWNRVFAGWDRSENVPDFTVGIHHPSGDVMKVCRDDDSPIQALNGGPQAQTWEITSAGQGWELGVTEPGSSGSPLFDQNGSIIGQLFGGGAACSGTVDNNAFDYYGRFGVSWDNGSSASTRLVDWLDPAGTAPLVMGSNPPLDTFAIDASVSVSFVDEICDNSQAIPTITLQNLGENDLSSAVISWSINGGDETTINFNGTLAQFDTESFPLTPITEVGEYTVTTAVTEVNGSTDENAANDSASGTFEIEAELDVQQVTLNLTTDDYPQETTWEFRSFDGTVIASGGPYNGSPNTLFTEDFEVSEAGCYVFEIFDAFGDGICCGFGLGSYTLTSEGGDILFEGGEFGSNEATTFKSSGELSIGSVIFGDLTLYPNPTDNQLTVDFNRISPDVTYVIVNTLGQKVGTGAMSSGKTTLDVSSYNTGMYFITLRDIVSNSETTMKFIKQ